MKFENPQPATDVEDWDAQFLQRAVTPDVGLWSHFAAYGEFLTITSLNT